MPLVITPFVEADAIDLPAPIPLAAVGAAALNSDDPAARLAAVYEVDASTEPALLLARLDIEPDHGIRDSIIDRLVATGRIDAVRPLLGLIRDDDVTLRNAVIAALPRLGDALLPDLRLLLDDPDAAVRIAALNLAQGLRGPGGVDLALTAIACDPHVNVCAAAVDVVAKAGGPESIAPLQALAARFPAVPYIGFAVAAAIRRIG